MNETVDALDCSVFSVPFRHLWSTDYSGDQVSQAGTAAGLGRFVGDLSNAILKMFSSDAEGDPEATAWPLVLFGPSGTGKTSLAMSIISELAENRGARPMFFSAADFDRKIRLAYETDTIADLRRQLLGSGGLVIDDVHRLDRKPSSQHQLVQLLDANLKLFRPAPIVFTMDRSPLETDGLDGRLVSRLVEGLSCSVQPPGPDARKEIVRYLAQANQLSVTEAAVNLIVDRFNATVPRLHHLFSQLVVHQRSLSDGPLQPVDVDTILQLFQHDPQRLDRFTKLIASEVAREFHLKVSDLKSNSRKQSVVQARGVAIYLCRSLLSISFSKIGYIFGNRDHSTVMHAHRKIEALIACPDGASAMLLTIDRLRQKLAEQLSGHLQFD